MCVQHIVSPEKGWKLHVVVLIYAKVMHRSIHDVLAQWTFLGIKTYNFVQFWHKFRCPGREECASGLGIMPTYAEQTLAY